jgi:hemolysin III
MTIAEPKLAAVDPPNARNHRREEIADGCIHVLGLGLALGAAPTLLYLSMVRTDGRHILAVAIYALGLILMLTCSACCNMAPRSRHHEWLRRFDHAAIFLMIAGTYTPFLLARMGGAWGWGMLAFVWTTAIAGVGLVLIGAGRFQRFKLTTYLLLGWSIVAAPGPLKDSVAASAIALLLIGGVLYSLGVVFHLWQRLSYHTAIWHGFVLVAASCHYAAVLLGVVLPTA